ncbi:MAG: hypothetical protein QOJ75_31 [Chloroflexota bacterium]|jgi:hypothetical protein|nr:hypothetical protein [Chloroflexota bacterium]
MFTAALALDQVMTTRSIGVGTAIAVLAGPVVAGA